EFCVLFVVFFFSSRRRHTRCLSDWSSDVCSSDLVRARQPEDAGTKESLRDDVGVSHVWAPLRAYLSGPCSCPRLTARKSRHPRRSEERRVGKECRSRRCRET